VNFLNRILKNTQYEISWKSIQWESSRSIQMDGWTDTHNLWICLERKSDYCIRVRNCFSVVLKIVWNFKCCIFWDLWFVSCTNFSAEWPAFEKIKEAQFQLYVKLTFSLDQYESNQICISTLLNTNCNRNMLISVRRCRWTDMLHFVKSDEK
jgi:hypothetical protein